MHRSGTSLAAHLLLRSGADLGSPFGFVPPDRWNQDGYFEQIEIISLNRQMLHGAYGKLAYFRVPDDETIYARGMRLLSGLHAAGRRYAKCLVKDPRFCITASSWQRNGVEIEKVVIVIREPIEVARSLQRRNGITLHFGMKLWELHYRRLLNFVKNREVWWVSNSHLTNPLTFTSELAEAGRYLGLSFAEMENAAVAGIVREQSNEAKTSTNYDESLSELWTELCERHRRQLTRAGAIRGIK